MAAMNNVCLSWAEEEKGTFGDGISRPNPNAKVHEYRLIVYPQGSRPMTWITRAETKRHAIKYAKARWPGSAVEVA